MKELEDKIMQGKEKNPYFVGYVNIDHEKVIHSASQSFADYFRKQTDKTVVGQPLEELFPEIDEKINLINPFHMEQKGNLYRIFPFDVNDDAKNEDIWLSLAFILETDDPVPPMFSHSEEMSAEELMEILEGSFDGILVTDKKGKVLYVNDSYERVAEITKEDLKGKSMSDLINPVWMPNSVAYIVAEKKKPVSLRQRVKSGRHIMVTGRPVIGEDQEIKKIVINVRDITEIYSLTAELEKSNSAAKLYMDKMSDLTKIKMNTGSILAVSQAMKNTLSMAEKVANFQTTVLILGESGVGKEEVAKFIHNSSIRKKEPFIAINCGAIPDTLLDSELFGYEKGAFTGAMAAGKAGLLEEASGGTVFLDEIGETPLDFQVKLLRFLESKEVRRVGSGKTKQVDVRILAATNRNLVDMIAEGTFRQDLYYRLNVVQIEVPPLRKRKDDILPLATFFLHKYNMKYGQEKQLTKEVVDELERQEWSGNVRELKNTVENMVIISNNEYLQTEDLPWEVKRYRGTGVSHADGPGPIDIHRPLKDSLDELEKRILLEARKNCHSTREIAELLQVNQSTVVRKLQKYGIE